MVDFLSVDFTFFAEVKNQIASSLSDLQDP